MSEISPNQPHATSPRRIVVKVGSAILAPRGNLDHAALDRLVDGLAGAVHSGAQPILVSSGAVAAGYRSLGFDRPPTTIRDKQAAAAIGQPALVSQYGARLSRHGLAAAQVLLTQDDFDHRGRFLNARHTLDTLLEANVIPIINENDSVSFEEFRVGDNDRLSALVATLVRADLLVLLSASGGLREGGPSGEVIPEVDDLDAAAAHVDGSRSESGTGGFVTKLDAARVALGAGVPVVIAPGPSADLPDPVARVLAGDTIGTRIVPRGTQVQGARARKLWLRHAPQSRGTITIDDGAARALIQRGASLLPKGVTSVDGPFDAGAIVDVRTNAGVVIARGLASYPASDIARIAGVSSGEIAGCLGYHYCDEVVHRDDMVLINEEGLA